MEHLTDSMNTIGQRNTRKARPTLIVLLLILGAVPDTAFGMSAKDACDLAFSYMHGPNERPDEDLTAELAGTALPDCQSRLSNDPENPKLIGAMGLIEWTLGEPDGLDMLKKAAKARIVGAIERVYWHYYLGIRDADGDFIAAPIDETALEWALKGAELGDAQLQADAASLLWKLHPLDHEKVSEGVHWARAAARRGHYEGAWLYANYLTGDYPLVSTDRYRTLEQRREGEAIKTELLEIGYLEAQLDDAVRRLSEASNDLAVNKALNDIELLGRSGLWSAFYVLGEVFRMGVRVPKAPKTANDFFCRAGQYGRDLYQATEEHPLICPDQTDK